MSYSISYVYDKNSEGKTVLLGADIRGIDDSDIKKKSIYVGIPFVLEDFDNDINRNAVGIPNLTLFAERYNALNAAGVVFFPQTGRHAFLEDNEEVVLWNGDDRIEEILNNALAEYKKDSVSDTLEASSNEMEERIANLDDEDPFIEFYGGNSRARISNR